MSQKISFEIAQDRNDASESTSDNIFRDVKSIVELAIRRFWTISIAAALVFGLIGFYTFTQTPQYTSTATVIVDSKQTNVIDLGAVLSGAALNTAVIDTEVRVMGSKALLAKVVEKENLIEDPEFNPTLIPPKEPGMLARLLPGSDEAEETEPLTEEDIKEIVLRNLMWKVQVSRVGTTYLMQVTVTSESAENAARLECDC